MGIHSVVSDKCIKFRYYASGTDSFLHCVDFCTKDYDY